MDAVGRVWLKLAPIAPANVAESPHFRCNIVLFSVIKLKIIMITLYALANNRLCLFLSSINRCTLLMSIAFLWKFTWRYSESARLFQRCNRSVFKKMVAPPPNLPQSICRHHLKNCRDKRNPLKWSNKTAIHLFLIHLCIYIEFIIIHLL